MQHPVSQAQSLWHHNLSDSSFVLQGARCVLVIENLRKEWIRNSVCFCLEAGWVDLKSHWSFSQSMDVCPNLCTNFVQIVLQTGRAWTTVAGGFWGFHTAQHSGISTQNPRIFFLNSVSWQDFFYTLELIVFFWVFNELITKMICKSFLRRSCSLSLRSK